eukprot:sb/3474473/
MPQITMENASLYGSFLDNSDREMILSSVASFVSKHPSNTSISAKQTSSESVGSKGVSDNNNNTKGAGAGGAAKLSPFKHDLGVIQNSLTHNGITEQNAVPLSRNRPASERHRRREVNSYKYSRTPIYRGTRRKGFAR